MSQTILTRFTVANPSPITVFSGNVYTVQSNNLYTTNITTGTNSTVSFNSGGRADNIAAYNNIIYVIQQNTVYTYNLQSRTSGSFSTTYAAWYNLRSCVHNGYLYYSQDGNTGFGRILLSTNTTDVSWNNFWYTSPSASIVGLPLVLTGDGNFVYFVSGNTTNAIGRLDVSQPFGTPNVAANLYNNFITIPSHTIYGLSVVNGWLYVSAISTTPTSKIMRFKLTAPATNFDLSYALPTTINYSGTNYTSLQNVRGIAATSEKLYVMNSFSTYALITAIALPPGPYKPFSTFYFDKANTFTVSSGNLKVTVIDPSNTSTNEVYYQYAINNGSYTNSGVYAGTSPYTFYIPTFTDISNTIYVNASNSLYVSDSSANLQVIVLQIPRSPPTPTFTLVGNGNVQVIITETASVPYYYLNNVSYYLYAYNRFGGTNLSGNTSLLIYNQPVGVLSNTNYTYSNIVSYVNTGLTANTYTMYVIARNDVGNSNPVFANIAVLTTPSAPSIDTGNTKSLSSGNLTISINDTVNTNNQVYYLYSLDGINYGNSRAFRGGNTRTVFTVTDTGNAQIPLTEITYTLYITAVNSLGNSTPTTAPVIVYMPPLSPIIDVSNTQSLTSGNLTVYVNDTVNSSMNGIYYLYSMDGINYGNSGAYKTGNTTVFTISNTGNAQVSLTARTYTLYVAAANPVGNTVLSPATAIENVYVIPSPPTIDQTNTKSITSGNLNVAFTDTFNNGNNQVEYTYFIYDSTAAPLFFV